MSSTIRDFVMAQPLFDAHEHLETLQEFAQEGLPLAVMASYANADLVTARGPATPQDPASPDAESPEFPKYFFDAWERARNTAYCRAVERACEDMFGVAFRLENVDALRRRIQEVVSPDPEKWYVETLEKKANVKWAIKDSIHSPEQAADGLYPDSVRFNYRDDPLLCIRCRQDVAEREARWKRSIHSLEGLLAGLMDSISTCLATGKVTCFKIGIAYYRGLVFGNPTRHEAERAFNRLMSFRRDETHDVAESFPFKQPRSSARGLRSLHDYLVHQYVRRATDEGLPIQVHTGYLAGNGNELGNVNPIQLTTLIRLYGTTRFDLFHSGWPYHDIMCTLGKHYPNVWINMAWSWAMNPIVMEHALDAFLDAVPYNKIFAFGADTVTPFTTYAYAGQAREGIARVLERRVARGDMQADLAETVARAIMLENGEAFHGLGD